MASADAIGIHDQTNLLPKRELVIVFVALAFGLLVTFIDQNSIAIALPTIGRELDCTSTVEWAGTSSLIANTAFQVLYGRFSDIFGRKVIIIACLLLLAVGDLLCGFAQTGPQLYAFRGIAGMANGGIMALSMMIVSDVVTLEERGKYQGIIGSCVGLGNTIGPFIAAGFTQHTSWRDTFYLLCPLSVLAAAVLFFRLPPQNMPKEDFRVTVAKVDWAGIILASGGTVLLLIPVSGIGSQFHPDSPMVISMLTLGGFFLVAFIFNEWKVAKLPMIPLRLFKNAPLAAMLVQNFLIGIVWYPVLYFIPVYYQSARQLSLMTSAALLLPIVIGLTISSTSSGFYISRMNRYGEVIWTGFFLWTLMAGLHLLFGRDTPIATITFILFLEGMGVGCVFQPILIAAQAHSTKSDRAVVISARNFIRSLGGAVGLAISSAIFSNSLQSHLPPHLPRPVLDAVHKSTFATPNLTKLDSATHDHILDAYASASRSVFIMWVAGIGGCLMLMVFIKDKGLQRKEERVDTNIEVGETTTDTDEKNTISGGNGANIKV
ncbi:MFS general substrate transporter [Lindgomyces ingoldianus]|uniref:MFS general substrate transporter n=1 Tax=Lindgomyces ingoldianus TaxID=673940 RepID=A0ACB6QNK4_9PLEO|nr:MFS general substrate transporter [Lindgomyces ingoldianus]KAF2467736.1 MFS general substrate transporter [Lindgomyces ingoldianus]